MAFWKQPFLPDRPDAAGAHGARRRHPDGPVSYCSAYLGCERGPELITGGRSGYVSPARSFGFRGGMTVNQTLTFNICSRPDEDDEEKIRRVLQVEVRDTFRGVFAGAGMRMA